MIALQIYLKSDQNFKLASDTLRKKFTLFSTKNKKYR